MPDALDLSPLPPERRAAVAERYWRELAAVRIREVYPHKLTRYRKHRAMEETARALRQEEKAFAFVTGRYVRRVVYEDR